MDPGVGPSSSAGRGGATRTPAEWSTYTPDMSRGSGNKSGIKRDQPTAHIMKKEDGDMCSREDIQVGRLWRTPPVPTLTPPPASQHDLLEHIFADTTRCFSVPPVSAAPRPISQPSNPTDSPVRLCFAELYAYALAASPKITKGLKEALLDLQPGGLPGKTKAGHGKSRRKKQGEGEEDELAETDMESYDGLKMGFMKLCLLVSGRVVLGRRGLTDWMARRSTLGESIRPLHVSRSIEDRPCHVLTSSLLAVYPVRWRDLSTL